ncbi:magnesium transporter MgtE N-terminal domain-containing protein [Clostridium luticellarii]|jgi:CBS domain-containing protein/sporulation protein YlmC with PRC-barrel domain|uniref:Magnesium transporter MgtE n=1 Tax=Clostridium luticellarii TaxID=1691940 RepID=A0A2T0BR52_9CLOT|nr:CBS domain-containing protein [Clostridium luticellarii]MCI1944538.1 CBS domain-containing protein [Clostridium luticellarii]MCI1968037.1 CBS domain-containing protein [Clostridium luticellarii]MCI1995571.1 CBS domain-containing protein [Clostridium luticellarii]MCI2039905.1 CBS domain-containing protein [Clostridium luticellarii]PRR86361.1 Magnesium transporter MgtE [Clostridium luticellarii]
MKKLTSFFLSKVLYKKVYNEFNEYVGKLLDIYVSTDHGMPRAIGYRIKEGMEISDCECRNIDFYDDDGRIIIKGEGIRGIILQSYSYLLSKHLLDKQIVDINGKKLVRVNDLRIAKIAGEYRVVAVDTGVLALSRRLGVEHIVNKLYDIFNKKPEDSLIIWDNVESLEMVNNNLKLSVPYKKLSKLHPADLADILEDMDVNYRKKVFESLDQGLAADTLEEIQPKIQADILENLSQSKRDEVLFNMPKDEIADILDEVDEDTAEKILLNMKKGDAEEVRTLMDYNDETVGSIMKKDFISFNVNITVNETIELFREINPDDEVSYYIYIVDDKGRLQGVISLKSLILAGAETKLKEIMVDDVVSINHNERINRAIEECSKYNLLSMPVTDDEDKLCGIVVINDIVEDILIPSWKKRLRKVG